MTPASEKKGIVCLCLALVCFSSVPLFLKYFTAFLDSWTVNGVRYGVAALFWLPFTLRNRGRAVRPGGRNVWKAAVVPAVVNAVGQTCWAVAPYYNDAGFIAFVVRSCFLFGIVFGFWFLHEERELAGRWQFWVGAGAIVAGVVIMYGGGLRTGGTSPVGMAIILFTAVCWGLYAVSVRKFMAGFGARLSFGVISLYTAVLLLPLMFLVGDWQRLGGLDRRTAGLLVLSGLVGIAFAHVLSYRAIHALGPVVTQGGESVAPFLTALGAWVILGEALTGMQWAGGLLLAMGCVVLVTLRRRPRRPD